MIFGDFQNPVQPQIGQRLHGPFIRRRTPCRQRLLVPGSGKLRYLFQVQPQWIVGFQLLGVQALFHQLRFLTQTQSRLSAARRFGEVKNIQIQSAVLQCL